MALSPHDQRVVSYHAWRAASSAHMLAAILPLNADDAAHVAALLQEAASILDGYYEQAVKRAQASL